MATTYDAQNEKFKSFINYIQGVLKINKFNTVEQAYAISNRENLMNNPKYVGILNDLIVSTSNLPLTNKQK
ncbi:unnamed protein product [Adineta steineri]|uniref:Uncharacterized protein n=1 Tax=Adineta steineri TaxID=433720 RepID=A0A814WCS6_9BILA|nr:unnamed protein product [Adineta steineri]